MALPSISVREIVELMENGSTVEAKEKIAALHQAALELQEENRQLKARLGELEDESDGDEALAFEDGMYWMVDEDGREGPYCTRCWDEDGNMVRLRVIRGEGEFVDFHECPHCKSNYA